MWECCLKTFENNLKTRDNIYRDNWSPLVWADPEIYCICRLAAIESKVRESKSSNCRPLAEWQMWGKSVLFRTTTHWSRSLISVDRFHLEVTFRAISDNSVRKMAGSWLRVKNGLLGEVRNCLHFPALLWKPFDATFSASNFGLVFPQRPSAKCIYWLWLLERAEAKLVIHQAVDQLAVTLSHDKKVN